MDDAKYAIFICDYWFKRRRELKDKFFANVSLETVVNKILDSKHNWDSIAEFIGYILQSREKEERQRP